MSIRIVRLGEPRAAKEGLRIGTVRRPPRGVPKADWAKRDFYDVWLPELAPSEELLKVAHGTTFDDKSWKQFARRFRSEMTKPEAARLFTLLSGLSQYTNFAVGCYCADEARCHRSILRELFGEHGAKLT